MKSIWRHRLSKEDKKNYDFNEIILNSSHRHHHTYIHESKYYEHLNNYRKFIRDENIFVIHFEDLILENSKIFHDLSIFLGLEFMTNILPHYNWSRHSVLSNLALTTKFYSKYPKLTQKIKNFLRPIFNLRLLKNKLQYSKETPFVSQLAQEKISEIVMPDYKNICQYVDDQKQRFG